VTKQSLQRWLLAVGLLVADIARAETIVFQDGTLLPGGAPYAGTQDTEIEATAPALAFGSNDFVRSDLAYLGSEAQGLLRFDDLFGAAADRIPLGSTITSAVLTLEVFNSSNVPVGIISLYQMTTAWSESSSWNSLVDGVQVGTDTVAVADDAHTAEQVASTTFDVLASLQTWSAGDANLGWVILNDGTDGMEFRSSEYETVEVRPMLTVTFTPPEPAIPIPALSRHGTQALLAVLTMIAITTLRRSAAHAVGSS
jgi:hypothetical protein